MRILLLILIVVAVALALTNPSLEEFRVFVEQQSERLLQRETGQNSSGGALGRIISGLGGQVAGEVAERATERKNYYLFSHYTLDFDGPEREGNEWRFLGIGGQFIELERPEAVRDLEKGP